MLEEGLALKHAQPALPCRGMLGAGQHARLGHTCAPCSPATCCPPVLKPTLNGTPALSGAVVLCVSARFILYLRGRDTAEGSRSSSAAQQSLPSS